MLLNIQRQQGIITPRNMYLGSEHEQSPGPESPLKLSDIDYQFASQQAQTGQSMLYTKIPRTIQNWKLLQLEQGEAYHTYQ